MLEHNWVQVVGYKEVPGKPALYGTTKQFLDHFSLSSLNELPPLPAVQDEKISQILSEPAQLD
jgi:segregation and condensation protein B